MINVTEAGVVGTRISVVVGFVIDVGLSHRCIVLPRAKGFFPVALHSSSFLEVGVVSHIPILVDGEKGRHGQKPGGSNGDSFVVGSGKMNTKGGRERRRIRSRYQLSQLLGTVEKSHRVLDHPLTHADGEGKRSACHPLHFPQPLTSPRVLFAASLSVAGLRDASSNHFPQAVGQGEPMRLVVGGLAAAS